MMTKQTFANNAFEQGRGILKLTPTWVPRAFCIPGKRIKLHPDDYYAYGGERGGIDERWFASTTPADNGPLTSKNEGLSHVVFHDGGKDELLTLKDVIDELKGMVIGDRIWEKYGKWPMYSKFFDNQKALPFHIHHTDAYAKLTGQSGKPEAYYFPPQVNNHGGDFPYTFFGLNPGTKKDQVKVCLQNFTKGNNKITDLSSAQALRIGTGWDVPPGVLHAPGSLCTYEPQKASDVFAMYESLTGNAIIPEELLWKNIPEEKIGDYDFLLEVIDWELNLDPEFVKNRKMIPQPIHPLEQMKAEGFLEYWICYKSADFSAKELTILPGREVMVYDNAAYGMILIQGHGKMGIWDIDSPVVIRFGQHTKDEFFVSENSAREGVLIKNYSTSEPLVMLKHFGPDNPDLDRAKY
jgi:hypothetical protein